MKAKFALAVLALTNYAGAAEPLDPYSKAIDAHLNCVDTYAIRYAATRESARDIADAALDACQKLTGGMKLVLLDPNGKFRFPVSEVIAAIKDHEAIAHRGAIRTVIETRNR